MITGNIFTPDLADSAPRRAGQRAHPSPKPWHTLDRSSLARARPFRCQLVRSAAMSVSGSLPFSGKGARAWRAGLFERPALALTVAALLVLCTVSPLLLGAHGIDYETAGGSALAKIHPGTYPAVAALMARLGAAPHPWRSLQRLLLAEPGLAIYLAALALMAVYVVAIARTPVTPLIDTFLPALVLTLMALRSVSPARLPSCWWRFSPPMRC
jgi:hypothetical protein